MKTEEKDESDGKPEDKEPLVEEEAEKPKKVRTLYISLPM